MPQLHTERIDLQNLVQELELQRSHLASTKDDLHRLNLELQRSNDELERFAYVASHDLRSPLKSVVTWAEMIDLLVPRPRSEDLDRAIRFVQLGAQKAMVLVEEVLKIARVKFVPDQVERINLDAVVAEILTGLDTEIKVSQAHCASETLPAVEGVPALIESLFKNLIENALTYRRRDQKTEVAIRCVERAEFYEFSVSDNGIGIPAEHLDRIFQMFVRLHTEKEHRGCGIGLAYCKKVVELFGGSIWARSTPGSGSTFYFTYPKTFRRDP